MKRILSLLVAMIMALSCVGITAMAEEAAATTIKTDDDKNFAAAMNAANAMTGDVIVEISGAVEFTDGMELNGSYTSITFVGKTADAKITINQTAGGDYLEAHGKTVAFTALTLAKANPAWSGNSGHMGNYFSVQGGTVTYTNCTFPNGACTNTGTATYTSCTFQNISEYGLWVYDDALVTVNGGTIDSAKGIKVYSEGEESVTSTLTVQNATFTTNVTAKPAVAIGYAESITLIGNTYNNTTGVLELDSGSDADCEGVTFVAQDSEGNDIASTLTAVDRGNNSAACGVLVDGKIYTTVTKAAKEATSGSTITLLHNSTETVTLPEGVALNTNSYTAENVTVSTPSYVAYIGEQGYETVQAAINAAKTDDAVVISAGEYGAIDISNKSITIQGTVSADGELLTTLIGNNPVITGHGFNGTIKDLKIGECWKVMYAEPAGNVTIDNVYVTKAMYGFHLIAYSPGLTWTIQNSYMNLSWANSFGVSYEGDAEIVIKGNKFDTTDPYNGGDVYPVNSYLPSVTVEENIFGKNTRISIENVTDTSKINISKNYHADGVENAFDSGSVTVPIKSYYTAIDENGNLTGLVTIASDVAEVNGTKYASLADAVAAATVGQTITLLANMMFSGQNAADMLSGYVIDLNENTITLSGNTYLTGETTIKNGNIVVEGYVSDSYLCLYTADTKLTLDDVNLTGTMDCYAVLNASAGGTLNIQNSTIDVVGNVTTPDTMGNIIYGGNVNVDSSTIKGVDTVRGIGFSNITIKNGSKVEITGTDGSSKLETGLNCSTVTVDNSEVTIENATKRAVRLNDNTLTLQNGATLTATDCTEGIIGIGTTDTVSVSSDSVLNAEDNVTPAGLSGSGTEEDPYLINSIDDLKWFRDNVNKGNTYDNQFVKLTADIDLKNEAWTPIGNGNGTQTTPLNKFLGTFDGGNFTISNLNVNVATNHAGLFGFASVVKNVKLNNATVSGIVCVGSLVGELENSVGTIDNCHISGTIKIIGENSVSALAGKGYAKIKNSSVDGTNADTSFVLGKANSTEEGDNVGGIVGHNGEGQGLGTTNCTVKNIKISGTRKVGGIVGTTDRVNDHIGNTVENVIVECTATVEYADDNASTTTIGGIVGNYFGSSTSGGILKNNTVNNVKFIVGNAKSAGALAGGDRVNNGGAPVGIEASANTASNITGATNNYFVPELPNAEVTNLGMVTVGKTEGDYIFEDSYYVYDLLGNQDQQLAVSDDPFDLNIAMQFVAKDSPEEAAANAYANYITDFFIKIDGLANGSFVGNGCYLAGYYPSFGAWVKIPLDGFTVGDGVVYPVISSAGFDFSYVAICESVQDFICGIYLTPEILAENPDISVNLTLGLSENLEAAQNAVFEKVDDYTYTADDFKAVAAIGEKKFTSLDAAIEAANADDTITLLDNIELENAIVIAKDKNIILDLNGKTITYNSTVQGEAMITNKGTLTINDSSEPDTGVINYNYTGAADSSYGKGNYTISNAGTLTVNGGKITIAKLSGHAKYPIDNNSTTGDAILVINGGHLYNYNTSAIRQFCNSTTYKNSVTIAGGLIEGYCAIWVQNPGKNTVNGYLSITGGEIKSTAAAYVNGTSALKDVSSRIYCTIDGEGGTWDEDSAVSITGGIINENIYLATEAPEALTVDQITATCNGRVELPEEEVEKFDFYGSTVNLGNSLAMKFYVDDVNIKGTDCCYAVINHYKEAGVESLTVPFEKWSVDSNGYYIIEYSDIDAKQIGDKIEITIYDGDGTQISVKREDGIKAYAERVLENAENSDAVKTTVVDMLNYGAAAQLQFNYKTDNLANADLTDEQKAYASEMPELINQREMDEYVYGTTLTLESKILLKAYFEDITKDMSVTVSFKNHSGTEIVEEIKYEDIGKNGSYYEVIVDKLVIADVNQLVTITVYNSDKTVYSNLVDSISSYLARQMPKGVDNSQSGIYEKIAKFTTSAYKTLH